LKWTKPWTSADDSVAKWFPALVMARRSSVAKRCRLRGHGAPEVHGEAAPGEGHGATNEHSQAVPTEGHSATEEHGQMAPPADRGAPQTDANIASVGPGGTVALGYAWHYWAGIMFSLSFLVLFGVNRWWAAIPYLLLVIYPGMVLTMGSHSLANFVWEAGGHAAFGLTLGIASYALLRSWAKHHEL
ncbi:MAG: hypothetical protein ACREJ0_02130, partial [Geminicoccaceae bacterium]